MKILVIRFSSIGDIVLTTPIIRCLKQQTNAEIHFITKKAFEPILKDNPYIDKLITIKSSIKEIKEELKAEQYDEIIDLHKNLRTKALKRYLKTPAHSFDKLNIKKWMLVKFKRDLMPDIHIVDRYFETVKHLGVKSDNQPGDFFIDANNKVDINQTFGIEGSFAAIAIGAQFATKRLPFEKLIEVIEQIKAPIILAGGPTDEELAKQIIDHFKLPTIYNACGGFNLQQSASIVSQASVLLTNDTGLMHIAVCYKTPIVSVWGNTVPQLGMYPYLPQNKELYSIHEVKGLNCRPCSKIGFKECPKGHFNCMMQQNSAEIVEKIQEKLK